MSRAGAMFLVVCAVACATKNRPRATAPPPITADERPIKPADGADCRDEVGCRKRCFADTAAGACRRLAQLTWDADMQYAFQLLAYACRQHDGKACTLVGEVYDGGDTAFRPDSPVAIGYYEKGCELRDGEGCDNLGWAYELQGGALFDRELGAEYHRRAATYYRLGCEGGIADDCNGLGELHRLGVAVELDAERAAELFERACRGGSAAGCSSLAQHGGGAAEKACSADNRDACCDLGHRYEHGNGVEVDYQRATSMYRTACEAGSGRGCDLWGYLLEHGLGAAQDYAQAALLYDKACGFQHVVGCYDLGRMYQHGMGVAQDDQRAVDIFEKTCADGTGPGCHSLAYMYQHGRGVSQSHQRALVLFVQACKRGEMEGCLGAAQLLETGPGGIHVDVDMSRHLVEHACLEKDHAPACLHLGRWALVGDMVPQNPERAAALFDMGCKLGHAESCDAHRALMAPPAVGPPPAAKKPPAKKPKRK